MLRLFPDQNPLSGSTFYLLWLLGICCHALGLVPGGRTGLAPIISICISYMAVRRAICFRCRFFHFSYLNDVFYLPPIYQLARFLKAAIAVYFVLNQIRGKLP